MSDSDSIEMLAAVGHSAEALHHAVGMQGEPDHALADRVGRMGLESDWIMLKTAADADPAQAGGHALAAQHNLTT